MRGATARLSWEEVVEWGCKAWRWCETQGLKLSSDHLARALKALSAPFHSHRPIQTHFSVSYAQYAQIVSDRVRGVTPTPLTIDITQLGPGVSTNTVPAHNWEDSWAALTNAYEARRLAQKLEVDRSVVIEVDRPDEPICVLTLGDMHIGSPSTDYPRLLKMLEYVRRKDIKVFAIYVGDVCDQMIWNKVKNEGRASPLSVHKEVLTAVGYLRSMMENGHLLGGVCGNHDLMSEKLAGLSYFMLAMEGFKAPIAKNELLLSVTVKPKNQDGETYLWEIRHNAPGHSQYNSGHGVFKWNLFNNRNSEILVAGDIHQSALNEQERHGKTRYGIQVGAFKDGDLDDYVVERGFHRGKFKSDFGVILWPNRHRIEPLDTEIAIERLEAFAERGKNNGPRTDANARKLRVSVSARSRRKMPRGRRGR